MSFFFSSPFDKLMRSPAYEYSSDINYARGCDELCLRLSSNFNFLAVQSLSLFVFLSQIGVEIHVSIYVFVKGEKKKNIDTKKNGTSKLLPLQVLLYPHH